MVSQQPLVKNTAATIVFPILDADGDPVGGATALDSEYSLNGGVFTDCASEATNITSGGANTGIYSLALAAGETNGDVVCIQVKTSSSGAKTTVLVFYTATQSMDTIDTNVDSILTDTNELQGLISSSKIAAQVKGIDDIDLSATMKTSVNAEVDTALNTAIPAINTADSINDILLDTLGTDVWATATRAITDKAGFSLAADQSAVTVGTVTTLTTWDKTGYALSVAGIDAIVDDVVEGTLTLRQAIRLLTAALMNKTSGGGTATLIARDLADTKARITVTADADGNRTAVTLDAT